MVSAETERTGLTRAVVPSAMHRAERGRREREEQARVFTDRRRHALTADESGRDHDPSVSLVEVGARGAEQGAAVLAGDEQGPLVDLAGGDVDELPAQSDGVRTPPGLLDVLH